MGEGLADVPTKNVSGYLAAISTSILIGCILAWMAQNAIGDARTALVASQISAMQTQVTEAREKIEQQSQDIRQLQLTVHLLSSLSEIDGRDGENNQDHHRQARQQ
jgi:hypothetical protein